MKSVSEVEVYTTKISSSLFLHNIQKTLMFTENNFCKKSRKSMSLQQFLVCFCYFWKVKSLLVLNLFISEYLGKILPRKEMKLTFSVKLQTKNLCFCLR